MSDLTSLTLLACAAAALPSLPVDNATPLTQAQRDSGIVIPVGVPHQVIPAAEAFEYLELKTRNTSPSTAR